MKKRMRKLISVIGVTALAVSLFAGCGNSDQKGSSSKSDSSASAESTGEVMSNEDIIKSAAEAGTVGNWGLGNEYEIQALLTKYGEPTDYLSQDFTMDGFDDDSIKLASAMTFNELGLVKNDYDGGYDYGNTVGTIDMNDEGVAMLEDNIFCTKEFAAQNPNTVKAFLYASLKGWAYAVEHPDEAAGLINYITNSVECNKVLLGERGVPISSVVTEAISEDQTDDEKEVIDYINNVVTPKSSTIDAPSPSGGSEVVSLLDSVTEKVMYGQETAQEAAEEFFTGANEILAGK